MQGNTNTYHASDNINYMIDEVNTIHSGSKNVTFANVDQGNASINDVTDYTGLGMGYVNLTGKNISPDVSNVVYPQTVHSESRSLVYAPKLGDTLPLSIKLKIWGHKFVDFRDLLNVEKPHTQTLLLQDNSIVLQTPKRKPLSIQEWNMAWRLYFSTYVSRYPDETQSLLSYANDLNNMEAAGLNWSYYDDQFRRGRESVQYPWDTVRPNLDRKVAFLGPASAPVHVPKVKRDFQYRTSSDLSYDMTSQRPPMSSSLQTRIPKGFCIAFNTQGKYCKFDQNCIYKHQCVKCFKPHPVYSCDVAPQVDFDKSKSDQKGDAN